MLEDREGTAGHGRRVRAGDRADPKDQREAGIAGTGQKLYPAIQFENGSWYREQSKDMEKTIREGKLMERAGSG